MNIKVCGMREEENIRGLCQLPIHYIGFIFYDKSPRYVAALPKTIIPNPIQKVGVFVNATLENIEEKARKFRLDCIQLHGDESPVYCKQLQEKGFEVWKAFGVGKAFDFAQLKAYEPSCNYFLLDAKGKSYGGNGVQFDWACLENYASQTPFFLSGGIDLEHLPQIQKMEIPQLYGIDVNSKFEVKPALKDLDKIRQLLNLYNPTFKK